MESHKLALKLFVESPPDLESDAFIPVFHGWIQRHALPDHLLIDVADYKHVPEGPGAVLVAHEANLSTDQAGGRLGLLYFRKQPFIGADTFSRTIAPHSGQPWKPRHSSSGMQHSQAILRFRTDEVAFRIHDRLLAPNDAQTLAEIGGDLRAFLSELYGAGPASIEQNPDPRSVFHVTLKGLPSLGAAASLLQRLSPEPSTK